MSKMHQQKREPLLQIAFGLATSRRVLIKLLLTIPRPTVFSDMEPEKREHVANTIYAALFMGILVGGIHIARQLGYMG